MIPGGVAPTQAVEFNLRLLEAKNAILDAEAAYERLIHEANELRRVSEQFDAMALTRITVYKNAEDRHAQAELLKFDGETVGWHRYRARLADDLKKAAGRASEHRAAELSALQSLAALSKQEMHFAQYEPRETAEA